MEQDQIIIYQATNGETKIDVKVEGETLWLSQKLMSQLFDKDADTIGLHIKNVLAEGELEDAATTELFSVVQQEGKRRVRRTLKFYNLDMILAVGYRVNSKKGTQFRVWANKILKQYLLEGYAVNEKRLKEQAKQLESLKKTVNLLNNVLESKVLSSDEAIGLLKVVTDYSYALDILDKYDHQQLSVEGTTSTSLFVIDYVDARNAIFDLKDKFGGSSLFGNEKDNRLEVQ